MAFTHAIRWYEPLILGIILFQCVMFLATLYVSRRNGNLYHRIIVMMIIACTIRCSEYMNRYGNQHWNQLATQNYFDRQGVFVTIFICTPLLINSFIMLLSFVYEASQLLIQVKTKQLQNHYDQQKKNNKKKNPNHNVASSSPVSKNDKNQNKKKEE
jgi:transmembrane protein 18